MAATVIGAATVVIWVYLLFFRAGFWWAPYRSTPIPASVPARSVVAVIPARDEAPVIGRAVASLLAQDYRSDLHIVVMDDQSSDGTAEAARAAAIAARASSRLTVCRGKPVPLGWTGFPRQTVSRLEARAAIAAARAASAVPSLLWSSMTTMCKSLR